MELFALIAGSVIRQTRQQENALLAIQCVYIYQEPLNAKHVAQATSSTNLTVTLALRLTVYSVQGTLFLAVWSAHVPNAIKVTT